MLLLVKNYQFDHREYSVSEGRLAYVQRGNGGCRVTVRLNIIIIISTIIISVKK